jgi:RNA polymerase sigma-70 factor (ECF subfamily)
MSRISNARKRQAEFEVVAMPHSASLLRAARRLALDHALAEDLVQETLMLAWRSFDTFRAGTNIRAWLFKILFNAFYAQGRKLRSRPTLVPMPEGLTVESAGSVSLEAVAVANALETLSEDHRAVLLLGVIEGFTCREIATILSVPIGTVMSRLKRARQALRDAVEQPGRRAVESHFEQQAGKDKQMAKQVGL